jgi:hypothetical protein
MRSEPPKRTGGRAGGRAEAGPLLTHVVLHSLGDVRGDAAQPVGGHDGDHAARVPQPFPVVKKKPRAV